MALGLDFGTTSTTLCYIFKDKIDFIKNEDGTNTFPSFISMTEGGWIYGSSAKKYLDVDPTMTFFELKKFVGKSNEDAKFVSQLDKYPFKTIVQNGQIKIQVKDKQYTSEELLTIYFKHLKDIAEKQLQFQVKDIIVCVPLSFMYKQKIALKESIEDAGFNVIRMLNETTSGFICYRYLKKITTFGNLLLFHLGGGTFDVTIVNCSSDNNSVICHSGNDEIGGQRFTELLILHLVEAFDRKFETHNKITENLGAMTKIKHAAKDIKYKLSSKEGVDVKLSNLHENHTLTTVVDRETFEYKSSKLFEVIKNNLIDFLKNSGLHFNDINDIILLGKGTLVPKIQSLIREVFNGKPLNLSLVQEEKAFALGAASLAASLSIENKIQNLDVTEVSQSNIILKCLSNVYEIVKYGTELPFASNPIEINLNNKEKTLELQFFEFQSIEPHKEKSAITYDIDEITCSRLIIKVLVSKSATLEISIKQEGDIIPKPKHQEHTPENIANVIEEFKTKYPSKKMKFQK